MKKTIFIPAVVILCAAAILFGLTFGMQKIATDQAEAEHLKIMQTLLPGSKDFILEPYSGDDANIHSVHKAEDYGYVIETVTAGYAGDIRMLIGISKDGKVTGLVVREMSETAGLGLNALNDTDFLAQFLNTSGGVAIGTPGEADAFSGATSDTTETETEVYVDGITGATVTSKAIARCINSAVGYVTGADVTSAATSWGG
jgi:electron transport complex protein RnfG